MKASILIICVALTSCASPKTNTSMPSDNTGVQPAMDSSVVAGKVPPCIDSMIAQFKAAPIQNPPRKIYSYAYKGNTVYYVPALCCDFYSELYDSQCKLIGHPDGGFSGRGDGKLPDFDSAKLNEVLIWQDKRAK